MKKLMGAKVTKKSIQCPLERTLEIISGRWRVLILRELFFNGTMRFGELHQKLDGISQRILIQDLKSLESCKIIHRRSYPVVPPKVEYSLTKLGHTLEPILKSMSEWEKNIQKRINRFSILQRLIFDHF